MNYEYSKIEHVYEYLYMNYEYSKMNYVFLKSTDKL